MREKRREMQRRRRGRRRLLQGLGGQFACALQGRHGGDARRTGPDSYNGSMKQRNWKVWGVAAAVVVLVGGGAAWWLARGKADDVQYRTAKIERGPLSATVSASGAVNPVTQVSVGTQVSGQIKDLYVDFNSEVKAGQLIAVIDPETFEYRVRQAQADVDAARAAVLTAQANAASSRAGISRAQSDLTEAQRTHERNQSLQAQGWRGEGAQLCVLR